MNEPGFSDDETATLAIQNQLLEKRRREGFRKWNTTKSDDFHIWRDSYGNLYQYFPFVKPFKADFINHCTGHRFHRTFAKRKTMMKWLESRYQKNQLRWQAAQIRKAQRIQARAVYRKEHQPTKLQVLEEKIRLAEEHRKELETRIKRLRTAVKKSDRRIVGLKVALRKAVLPKEMATA